MFKGLSEKILALSGSYNYYKSECARLNERCEMLERDNESLRVDVKELLSELKNRQCELYSRLMDNELMEDTDKILDALMSNQQHFSMKFDENRTILESLEDSCMRIEKSSSYTNIKLDSKFEENKRLIREELSGRLE